MSELRERVLSAVRQALSDLRESDRDPGEPIDPLLDAKSKVQSAAAPQSHRELAVRFIEELAAIAGYAIVVADRDACASALTRFLQGRRAQTVAVQSQELSLDVAARLHGVETVTASKREPHELAIIDCGLLEARALIADLGAAIVVLDSRGDRVLPYLPRACAIVAGLSSLRRTLDRHAMACIADAAAAGTRGEVLIVAGPSRSADIEKTLVLGAHGPEALAVFIIENA